MIDHMPAVIVIVEDDPDISSILLDILTAERRCQVFLIADGQQALELILHYSPHLIILDYTLPHLNGLQIYELLLQDKTTRHIPVLFITAAAPVLKELAARGLPYLPKPFDIDSLLDQVNSLLRSR